MKLRYKLLTGYLVITALALILGVLGLNGYRIVHSHYVAVTQDMLPCQQTMMNAKQSALGMIVESRDYLRSDDEMDAQYARQNMDDFRESLRAHLEHKSHTSEAERGVAEEIERRGLYLIDLCNDLIDAYQRGADEETLSQGQEEIRLCKDELFEILDEHLAVHEQELLDAQNGIYQMIVRGIWMFLLVSVLILALGLATAFYMANAIVGPIHELEAGAGIIGGGDLGHRLDIKTGDEIERLAVAFNGMADRLADMMNTLEQRVVERTSELTTANKQLESEITERKRAEAELRESEERLRQVVENMPVMMDVFDADGNILVWNQECERVTGYSGGEIIGNPGALELLCPDAAYREWMMAEWRERSNDHRDWEWEITCKDESVKTVAWSNISAHFPIPGWASWGIGVDITERKRAGEVLRQRTAQLEALREMGLELVAQLDLDTLLHSVVARAVELLGGIYGGIYLYRPERDLLEWAVSVGDPAPIGVALRRGDGLAGKVWESGAAMIVDDYRHWEGRDPSYDEFDFASVVGVPVRWGDEFLGVLNVNGSSTRTFSEADVELLTLFASQAAVAICNAQFLQAEQEQRELAEALEEAAAAVNSTLDLDEVLDRILEQVERVVPGDVFNIMRIEGDLTRTVRWRGQERFGAEEFVSIVAFRVADVSTFRQMVETGKSVIIPDTSADPDWVVQPELEWLRSYVAAPIQVGGTTVGFLNVDGARPGQFGPADARRLEVFASHAAAAIENAQLYQSLQAHAGQLEQRVEERTAELKAQYAWLDAILRSATDGIVVTNGEGSIVQANPVAQAWLTQTLSPEEAGRLRETIRSLVARAEEQPVEFLELTGLDLELSAALVVEEGIEKPTAVVIDIHDASHLKALDRMKTRFITNISHELRTPITTIKLYAYLMNRHPKKWRSYLDVLAREADHQAQLVEGILEISSIDAGRIEMEPRPTPLDELAGATVASHKILAQERGLTLKLQPVPPSIPSLVGEKVIALVDPERMMQVLNNLVENAIRYTPEGGSVVVSTGVGEADGRAWATVTVTDTGMGIPEDELPHIFDRFFRGEEPRAMQLTGAGLGLAIVKEIVELHGGRVTVQSQAGEGSTFTVWLPLSDRG